VKLNFSNKKNCAMTLVEALMVIACLFILAALLLLPMLALTKHRSVRLGCVSNLKQVNLAFRIWEGDHNNQYPMAVSVTNKGAMELIQTGNVAAIFQVMSNELTTTKILVCPNDPDRTFATNWNDLNGSHISYFVSPDASEEYPQMILDGDDNFVIAGKPVKPGMLEIPPNLPVSWSGTRHGPCGNIGLADGSVQEESSFGLRTAFEYSTNGTGIFTNRIAIP
jgi:competence protein ComGC